MNMILSPMQHDYITREEFRDHDQYMKDGFEKVFEQIDNVEITVTGRIDVLETRMNKKFELIDKKFDSIDRRFDAIDKRFDGMDKKIDRVFNTLNNKIDDLGEKLGGQIGVITAILTKK
jgi:hypothetical protein